MNNSSNSLLVPVRGITSSWSRTMFWYWILAIPNVITAITLMSPKFTIYLLTHNSLTISFFIYVKPTVCLTYIYWLNLHNNMSTTQTEENFYAKEIFSQLQASKVNGFPLLAYTGLKASIFSETEIYLKAPSNPGKVDNIMISLDLARDTYIIVFNGKKGLISRHEDIYADMMAELIVSVMGVN